MGKRIRFDIKEQMVGLSGACFWYWNSFYSFLDSSGVPRQVYQRYPRTLSTSIRRCEISWLTSRKPIRLRLLTR